jgi:Fe-S cluster assembly iron-binding protein IscA
MLALTEQAAEVIRTIVAGEDDAPAEAGLRIDVGEQSEEGVDLDLQFVPGPQEGDDTLSEQGCNVHLSPEASALLDDKILDAHEHDDHVHFEIGEQNAA